MILRMMKMSKKNKIEEAIYEPQSLDEKNVKVINALRLALAANIDDCLKEIDSLKTAVSYFKDAETDYIELSVEKNDIVSKYSKANNGGSYNLPGVFASSMGSYDLDAMRSDNKRSEEVLTLSQTAQNQKDTYFKMMVRAQNKMRLYLNTIAKINTDIDAYLEQLAQSTSWQSNKSIKR